MSDALTRCVLSSALLVACPRCSTGYVLRAGYEEAKILWRRQPIERAAARGDLDADTPREARARRWRCARSPRDDARACASAAATRTLARVDADQVVHVVSAAYRVTACEPYTWWFPIVGRVPYKGYFSEGDAEAQARELERDGLRHLRPPVGGVQHARVVRRPAALEPAALRPSRAGRRRSSTSCCTTPSTSPATPTSTSRSPTSSAIAAPIAVLRSRAATRRARTQATRRGATRCVFSDFLGRFTDAAARGLRDRRRRSATATALFARGASGVPRAAAADGRTYRRLRRRGRSTTP